MDNSQLKRVTRETLSERFLAEGGIADCIHGQFRTDSTAWAIIALEKADEEDDILEAHRARLVREQSQDGRVSITPTHSESFWPTALAILAWQHSPKSSTAQRHSIDFLLKTTGAHSRRTSEDPAAHDTNLRGWPWVGRTHSWIEPTALAIIALKAMGTVEHERVYEAVRLILDRQLPHGGWNYGNTVVFGRELHPAPDSTGAALAGLAGLVGKEKIAKSLAYLQGEVDRLRTPVSLGWALLGLAAWDCSPANGLVLVERCLGFQSRYGDYDTSALCLLLVGALAGGGRSQNSPSSVSSAVAFAG
ncbi:MAG TPA: hypothetical protein VJR03_06790 [Nitrospira sp.]|nr:hypothetical protein [Nitrospira sp.]